MSSLPAYFAGVNSCTLYSPLKCHPLPTRVQGCCRTCIMCRERILTVQQAFDVHLGLPWLFWLPTGLFSKKHPDHDRTWEHQPPHAHGVDLARQCMEQPHRCVVRDKLLSMMMVKVHNVPENSRVSKEGLDLTPIRRTGAFPRQYG